MSIHSELRSLSRRRGASDRRADRRDNRVAYLFLAPWLLGLLAITIGPMIASLYLSFTDYNLLTSPNWIGLDNYREMLEDARLWRSFRVTVRYVVFSVPPLLVFALLIALLLNRGMRGLAFYRSVLYLPSMLGAHFPMAAADGDDAHSRFRHRASRPPGGRPRRPRAASPARTPALFWRSSVYGTGSLRVG